MNRSKDPILFERREELKRQIAAGEYRSLLDVISDQVGRAIQRLTKSAKPLPFWCNVTAIALVILAVDFLTSLLFGEFSAARYESIWAELEDIPSRDTLAHISGLMDYHDRIKSTRSLALDFNTGLNLLNSLLLPLLAFLLSNLGELFDLFF